MDDYKVRRTKPFMSEKLGSLLELDETSDRDAWSVDS